jgi:hypothetical protein
MTSLVVMHTVCSRPHATLLQGTECGHNFVVQLGWTSCTNSQVQNNLQPLYQPSVSLHQLLLLP